MSSTIPTSRDKDAGRGWQATGRLLLVVGAVVTVLGELPILALVVGEATDPFGVTTLMSLAVVALGAALLAAGAILGLVGLLVRRSWRRIALVIVASVASLILGLVVTGWIAVPELQGSEWVFPAAVSTLAITAAVATMHHGSRRLAAGSAGAVLLVSATLGWVVASRLEVDVLTGQITMRAAAADAVVIFDASESGTWDLRTAEGCSRGRILASGTYGPGWEEREDRRAAELAIPLGDRGLVAGSQTLVVCVRHGIARGEDRFEVTVDDTAPSVPTLTIVPVTDTGDGVHYTAATRQLRFSGTADPGRGVLEIHTAAGTYPKDVDVVDGRWSLEWELSQATDQASFGFVAEDAAGNNNRSAMVHVRFTGDPPPIALPEHPGLAVECRAEAGRTPDECATRARQALADRPELLEGAVRLIVTGADQYGSCYAESRQADGFVGIGFALTCP